MMIKLKLKLLPHQLAAVEKLTRLRVGALYMEMGTGKTLTALEIIRRRVERGKINRVIWLCPCSVKTDLRRNLERSADGWKDLITICGIETLSSSKRENARLLDDALCSECMLVVDESNLVKNPKAIRTKNITRIAALCKYRIILNGTPISRNEADMFAQWYLLDWRILGYSSYYSFAANHLEFDDKYKHRIRRVLDVEYLTDKIGPYSYQAKKEDCVVLPGKQEYNFYFSLTEEQRNHYNRMIDKYLSPEVLDTDYDSSVIYRAFTVCQQIASGQRMEDIPLTKEIAHVSFFRNPEDNPRIQALLAVLHKFNVNEKIVIWCKYTHEILDVSSVLKARGEHVELIYGKLSARKRDIALERFHQDSRILIANKACAGYGLNLQFCRYAVYYNQDYDWATRAQSEDRLHRIGQSKNVYLYNICAEYTIDERILSCLERKTNLVDAFRAAVGSKNNMIDWINGKVEEDLMEKEILKDGAIRIGLSNQQKLDEIKRYLAAHSNIKNVIIFSGDKFKFNLPLVNPQPETYAGDRALVELDGVNIPVQQISFSETEMYRTFYPLLEEIDDSYLLILNEMMRTSNRSDLKLNCTAKYTNQSPHRLVFEYFPFISEQKDFMILLDLSNSQMRKGIGYNEINLNDVDVKCIRHHYVLNVIPVNLPDGAQQAYEEKRDSLFDNLGNKHPDTIPRNLHKWTGQYKKDVIAQMTGTCVARDSRFKKLGVIPIKQASGAGDYIFVDLPDRRMDINDFIRRTQQEMYSYISTGLSIDNVYIASFNKWIAEMENFYDKTGLYE